MGREASRSKWKRKRNLQESEEEKKNWPGKELYAGEGRSESLYSGKMKPEDADELKALFTKV